MYDSHQSFSDDYQVSCEELDFLVDHTREDSAVLGSRMLGGGFGGCTLNLVRKSEVEKVRDFVSKKYYSETGISLESYKLDIVDGVQIVAK